MLEDEWVDFDGVSYSISAEWDEFDEGWVVTQCLNLDADPDEGEDPNVDDEILQEILLDKALANVGTSWT